MSFAVAHATVMRMLDHVASDERYLTATARMRASVDDAVARGTAALEFVESIPALAMLRRDHRPTAVEDESSMGSLQGGDAVCQLRAGAQPTDVVA